MNQSSLFPITLPFEGDLLYINVTPKAAKERIGKIILDENGKKWLKVYVTAPAENNQANIKVIEFLSKLLGVPKTSLTIIQGHTTRKKVIRR